MGIQESELPSGERPNSTATRMVLSPESARKLLHQTPTVNIGRTCLPTVGFPRRAKTFSSWSCESASQPRRGVSPSPEVKGIVEAGRSFSKSVESHREGLDQNNPSMVSICSSRQQASVLIAENKSELDASTDLVADDILTKDFSKPCVTHVDSPCPSSGPIYPPKCRNPFAKLKPTHKEAESSQLGDGSSDDDFDEPHKILRPSGNR